MQTKARRDATIQGQLTTALAGRSRFTPTWSRSLSRGARFRFEKTPTPSHNYSRSSGSTSALVTQHDVASQRPWLPVELSTAAVATARWQASGVTRITPGITTVAAVAPLTKY